jgi:hypothetical protein
MGTTRILIVAALLGGCFTQTAHASGYGNQFNRYGNDYDQQPLFVYQVGIGVQASALAEAQLRAHPQYPLVQKLQERIDADPQFLDKLLAVLSGDQPQVLQAPQTQLQKSCVRCHSGDEPKGGLHLTGNLTPATLKAIKAKMAEGAMPPANSPEAKEFSNQAAGDVLLDAIELLSEGAIQ